MSQVICGQSRTDRQHPRPRLYLITIGLVLLAATSLQGCATTADAEGNASGPSPDRYVVQRGDTLYAIAFRNEMDYRELAALNHIQPPYRIYAGRTLALRAGAIVRTAEPSASSNSNRPLVDESPDPTPAQFPAPAPSPGVTEPRPTAAAPSVLRTPAPVSVEATMSILVQGGDSLNSIARDLGVSPLDIVRANDLVPPYRIYPGDRLRIPASFQSPSLASLPAPITSPTLVSAPTTMVKSAEAPAFAATATDGSGMRWIWPTKGSLISGYNPDSDGRKGIGIGGRPGQAIVAASDGTVVYSGDGLIGYGRLIIIRHAAGYLSAYGHNRSLLVQEGQQVSAGQQIAEMGDTASDHTELHFEIRRDGKPVNPLDYLPAPSHS